MKKFAAVLLLCAMIFCGCSSLKSYVLGDIIPPLYDISTQSVYVESVSLTNHSNDTTVTFDSAADHDLIRMQFEGIKCAREENEEEREPIYTVIFTTRDGDFVLEVISESEFVIGEYYYEAVRFNVDMLVLENLTSK